MPFAPSDPRIQLATTPAARQTAAPNAPAQYFDFSRVDPDEVSEHGSRTWWVRGQNFVLAYTVARPGEAFEREGQPDEYVVLFPQDTAAAKVTAGSEESAVQGASMVVVPPGRSRIEITAETHAARLFSAASPDLLARCRNHADYAEPHANVAPFLAWPDPVDGLRIRVYPVADHPSTEGRFGRIFRCSTFMVNLMDADYGPRDATRLSPHHHDDFEQCSLVVDGQFVHHIRNPWTPDLAGWRPDEHVEVASPSVAVIPPPAVHTSQSVGQARNHLIDIFCPPRHDFSAKAGWVINDAEYPIPAVDGPQ